MKLKTIHIQNLRCCKDVTIHFDSMHALVGANNAGKSTILKALDLLFNPSTSKVNEESFTGKDTTLQIRIEGLFIDLTDQEKANLATCIKPDGSFHLARVIEMKAGEDDEEAEESEGKGKISIKQFYNKPQPKYDWLIESNIKTSSIKEWLKDKTILTANKNSFADIVGEKPTVEAWKTAAAKFVTECLGPDDFIPKWAENPKGYSNVLKANLPHFELIPAVRDAADESKVLKTNPFGRLISEIVKSIEEGLKNEITEKLKATTRRLNREGKNERLAGIVEVEDAMKGFLGELMPADLEIEFQPPTIETLLTTPKIFIDDGFRGSIDGKGHGLQRAVIFSILRSYAKLVTTKKKERDEKEKREGENENKESTKQELQKSRTLILGVEEPELYMHPTAQRTIRRVFQAISEGDDQIIFSTHSPLLVDVAYFDEIIRVEPADKETGKWVTIHQVSMASMIQDIETRIPGLTGRVSAGSMRDRYGHAYTPTRNEGFFAKKVILVEGQTESYCLPIYSTAMGHDFDSLGIAVIDCGGKDQIDRLYRIFNELGIACYVIFDYDQGNTGAVKSSVELLRFLGHATEAPTVPHINEKFSCFVKTWEKDLRSEIPDCDKHAGEATKHLGQCGKPLQARYIATTITRGEKPHVPATLAKIINQAVKAKRTGTCLSGSATTTMLTSSKKKTGDPGSLADVPAETLVVNAYDIQA